MPFKPPELHKCPVCGKSVYAAEEKVCDGNKYHKFCFKCSMCNKMLDSTTVANHELVLFCKQCHGRKYGPKGYGFGGGAGALGMDKGERFGNKECEMDNKPKGVAGETTAASSTGPKCPRCGITVYDAERAIGVTTPWHKKCFNCKACRKALDSTTMAEHEGDMYCKGCYHKNFGPHGKI